MVTDLPWAGLASSRVPQRAILSLLKCLKCVQRERSMAETRGLWDTSSQRAVTQNGLKAAD